MKVKLRNEHPDDKGGTWPAGYVNERPDSFWWLELGIADPVDDEAKAHQKLVDQKRARQKVAVTRQAQAAIAAYTEQQKAAEAAKHAEFEALLKGE